jgi:hypothetical protein
MSFTYSLQIMTQFYCKKFKKFSKSYVYYQICTVKKFYSFMYMKQAQADCYVTSTVPAPTYTVQYTFYNILTIGLIN